MLLDHVQVVRDLTQGQQLLEGVVLLRLEALEVVVQDLQELLAHLAEVVLVVADNRNIIFNN